MTLLDAIPSHLIPSINWKTTRTLLFTGFWLAFGGAFGISVFMALAGLAGAAVKAMGVG